MIQQRSTSTWVAAAAAGVVLLLLVVLAGGPVATADFWWHLKMGEAYVAEGPRPAADPMLHTAHADAPIPHEWLFSVGMFAIDRVAGFWGLRLVHALAVASILVLVLTVFRREGAAAELSLLAALCFAALAVHRLIMLRADLVSIPASFAIYALLLAPERAPSWRRVAAAGLIFLVWANVHGLRWTCGSGGARPRASSPTSSCWACPSRRSSESSASGGAPAGKLSRRSIPCVSASASPASVLC